MKRIKAATSSDNRKQILKKLQRSLQNGLDSLDSLPNDIYQSLEGDFNSLYDELDSVVRMLEIETGGN